MYSIKADKKHSFDEKCKTYLLHFKSYACLFQQGTCKILDFSEGEKQKQKTNKQKPIAVTTVISYYFVFLIKAFM